MKQSYKYTKNTSTFNVKHSLNVTVHIRRGDIEKYPNCDRFTPLDFFINNINLIISIHPHAHIHIYSDSPIQLPIKFTNLYYHYTDDINDSVKDIIDSHIFIMSIGSNISYFAGLLTKAICFFDKNKLIKCFNNMYNIYWSNYTKFIHNDDEFINKIKSLYT
jgi:hypothetical protein